MSDLIQEQFKERLTGFATRFGPSSIESATVLSINNDGVTITAKLSDDSVVDDVRLKSVIKDGNKVLLIPVVNTEVLVGSIQNSKEYAVIAVDEVSEVLYVIDGVTYSVDNTGFLLQKGGDTLKDALNLLIEAVQQIAVVYGNNPDYIKLTQASSKINNLLR